MEKCQIFFPASSSPSGSDKSASPSWLDMGASANPHICPPQGSNENGVKAETRNQTFGDGIMRKREGDNKEMRKHRFAFQTRSQVDILDDGYRWRKYGQKTVKNSKFPRSYYKCTYSGCNVKKQVQRNTKDEGIVVTTYDGVHTHPTERSNETFEEILRQMQTYIPF